VSARALLLVAVCLAAGACSRQDAAWRQAESQGTESGFQSYLETYPDGLNAHEARRRLAELQDGREWSRAQRLGTPESYQRYLARFPEGARVQVARERLTVFLEPPPAAAGPGPIAESRPGMPIASTDLVPAQEIDAPDAVDVAVSDAVPRPDPHAPPTTGPDHWLQLGAFVGGEAAADMAWQRLALEHGESLRGLGHRVIRTPLDSGDLWRLFAGPVTAGEGETRCGAIRLAGGSCLLRAGPQVMIPATISHRSRD
jgi:cell division septation protein DedD